jgi:hypothetical protein
MKKGAFADKVRDFPADHSIQAPDGTRFVQSPGTCRLILSVDEYFFDDILEDDIVLDIGANAGAFCIRAARKSRHVVAVEPVTTDILEKNIRLNDVSVRLVAGALGAGDVRDIEWDGVHAVTPTYSLKELIGIAGGCDFLKCDCEGAEWLINPEDLAGIRRIEMELHIPPIGGPPNPGLLGYIGRNYEFTIDRDPSHVPLGIMGILHARRREMS